MAYCCEYTAQSTTGQLLCILLMPLSFSFFLTSFSLFKALQSSCAIVSAWQLAALCTHLLFLGIYSVHTAESKFSSVNRWPNCSKAALFKTALLIFSRYISLSTAPLLMMGSKLKSAFYFNIICVTVSFRLSFKLFSAGEAVQQTKF